MIRSRGAPERERGAETGLRGAQMMKVLWRGGKGPGPGSNKGNDIHEGAEGMKEAQVPGLKVPAA